MTAKPSSTERRKAIRCVLVVAVLLQAGCAVHWYNRETGTEHLLGFGHMKMKVSAPKEGVRAAVKGTEVLGASVGMSKENRYVSAGWHRTSQLEVLDENTSVRLEWPNNNVFNVRVGSVPPFLKENNEAGADTTDETTGENKEEDK